MRCASVSIGIGAYEHEHYCTSAMRLQFAGADAKAFHRYATTAWDDAQDVHCFLIDQEASRSAVGQAFQALALRGQFDLLLVYLSGHGEVDGHGSGWFCLADAQPRSPSLDAQFLGTLLGQVSADRVLLFVDCCHAEAVTAGMPFFASLDERLTRVFVASARTNQKAWEDETLRRSLFSDVLLRALSTDSTIADVAGMVDLEARLLPWLREQVPLNAAALKRGEDQVPVAGGLSVAATRLPTVTSRSLGRELSIAETVRRRVRRLVTVAAFATVAGLLLLDALAYHLEVAGTGEILVRPGLRWAYGLMPVHIGRAADTGLRLADVDPTRDDMLAALSTGSLSGLASHLDEQGLRPWLARMQVGIQRARRASVVALAAGRLEPMEPDDDQPPIEETVFLARLMGESVDAVAKRIYPLDRKVKLDCATSAATHLDFTHLLSSTPAFEQDAAWHAATAPDDAPDRALRLADLVRFAAYRSTDDDQGPEQRAAEFRAYAAALWTLIATAADRGAFVRVAQAEIAPLLHGWCRHHARFALAMLADDHQRAKYESQLVEAARPALTGSLGLPPTREQHLAYLSLMELGARGLLAEKALALAEELVRADEVDLCPDTPAPAFVKAVAPTQRLPQSLIAALVARMHTPPAQHDFGPLCAFATLSANSRFLDADVGGQLQRWATENAREERTMSDFHRGLGYLAVWGGLAAAHRDILVARLSPSSRFPPSAANYRGEMVIAAGDEDALVGLGRAAQVSDLPKDIVERLANAAMGRPLLQGRREILLGLAAQWYQATGINGLPGAITDRIEAARGSATRRSLEVEVAAVHLATLTESSRRHIVSALLDAWRATHEPEIRVSLARTVARATAHPFPWMSPCLNPTRKLLFRRAENADSR